MLKDLIYENKERLENEDNLSIFMRGELEVIVRDKNNKVVSYQKGSNTVSDFMKQEIIHLLAGDIFSEEKANYENASGGETANIYTTFSSDKHSPTKNEDGMLFSGYPFFFDASNVPLSFVEAKVDIDNTNIPLSYISPRYPVKMLFGTGSEYSGSQWSDLGNAFGGFAAVENILGYKDSTSFYNEIDNASNYYSDMYDHLTHKVVQCKTVQATDTQPKLEPHLSANSIYGISGAIKNCLITDNGTLSSNYTSGQEMANLDVRGVGRPSFIYASRKLESVKTDNLKEFPGFVKIGKSDDTRRYENKLVFSVLMPRTTSFYPYNGWILKEAGLFSDALFRVKGEEEEEYINKMPCGIMLAKRYIAPILKTSDNSVEFIWSIYIS